MVWFRGPHGKRADAKMLQTHIDAPADAGRPAAPLPDSGVDLKRYLLWRVSLFALAIGLAAVAAVFVQTGERLRGHIARTGSTVENLLAAEVDRPRDSFRRTVEGLDLTSLDGIGPLLGICVKVEDIYKRAVIRRCFDEGEGAPAPVRAVLAALLGPDVAYRGVIGQYPGVKVGEFTVTPDLDAAARDAWSRIGMVLGMTFGILLLNGLVVLPVRRALAPAEQILAVLARMEAGDLAARMPRPRLIELRRIAAGFDHLVERLEATLAARRQLAQRLLAVREEERRHLARELHDEFGQCLASVSAEAAFIGARAERSDPSLLPAARAVSAVTAHMMESLQGILHQLRPVGLEEFGLAAALEQLVGGWRRRQPDCQFHLEMRGAVDDLPDELTVSLYRIVQESLTNALRHGAPRRVAVSLVRDADGCRVTVDNDGQGRTEPNPGSGLGVLGMRERVEALGGQFDLLPLTPQGMRVAAVLPVAALIPVETSHA